MNIIITGAGKGIGFETAIKFADNSHTVIAISRNIDNLMIKSNELNQASNGKIIPISLDLTQTDYSILDEQLNQLNEIHILINNAGILINKPFLETSDEDWRKVFETNLFSTARMIRYLLGYMSISERTHIVNISSMGGFQGTVKFPGLSAYSASKSALVNLTELLAVELDSFNISVNCLALGAVRTEMLKEAFPKFKAKISPNEIADYIYHYALTGHKFFNGKILPVSITTP